MSPSRLARIEAALRTVLAFDEAFNGVDIYCVRNELVVEKVSYVKG